MIYNYNSLQNYILHLFHAHQTNLTSLCFTDVPLPSR